MANNQATFFGSFVPTTNIWDVDEMRKLDVRSPEFKELLIRLYQNINLMALSLNDKTTGLYPLQQFINGKQYFPNPNSSNQSQFRPSNSLLINFGALPNAASKSVAHGITVNSGTTWTHISAYATNPSTGAGYPIPNTAQSTTGIASAIDVSSTNVTITTSGNLSAFTTTFVFLEWLTF